MTGSKALKVSDADSSAVGTASEALRDARSGGQSECLPRLLDSHVQAPFCFLVFEVIGPSLALLLRRSQRKRLRVREICVD